MKNHSLIQDYVKRSVHRLAAIEVLYERKSWADVVRESQEAVELTLKALLRSANLEVPRVHDVSQVLLEHRELFSAELKPHIEGFAQISKELRRDRELAFYGTEDLTPSDFYSESDAKKALSQAKFVVETVKRLLGIS